MSTRPDTSPTSPAGSNPATSTAPQPRANSSKLSDAEWNRALNGAIALASLNLAMQERAKREQEQKESEPGRYTASADGASEEDNPHAAQPGSDDKMGP